VPVCYYIPIYSKGLPQQAEVAQGVPGRLSPRMFFTFDTTGVVGRQPYAPAAFTHEKTMVLILKGRGDPRAHSFVGGYGKNYL